MGMLLTLCLPYLPFYLCAVEVGKRINEKMPWAGTTARPCRLLLPSTPHPWPAQ